MIDLKENLERSGWTFFSGHRDSTLIFAGNSGLGFYFCWSLGLTLILTLELQIYFFWDPGKECFFFGGGGIHDTPLIPSFEYGQSLSFLNQKLASVIISS